jgi:hypothetical protein
MRPYGVHMPYPHISQFEEAVMTDRLRHRRPLLDETIATRGRSMWRASRPARRRRRFSLLLSRA